MGDPVKNGANGLDSECLRIRTGARPAVGDEAIWLAWWGGPKQGDIGMVRGIVCGPASRANDQRVSLPGDSDGDNVRQAGLADGDQVGKGPVLRDLVSKLSKFDGNTHAAPPWPTPVYGSAARPRVAIRVADEVAAGPVACGLVAEPGWVSVRREWAPWRTPWIWRKLRPGARPHRGSGDRPVVVFRYEGTPQGVGSFLAGAFDQLTGGTAFDAVESDHPVAFAAGEVTQLGLTRAVGGLLAGSASGGGGGSGGEILGALDEAVLIIFAAVAAAILLVVAVPLGILAVEVVLGLLVLIAGVCLRVAHVRPWTIVVRQDGETTAAFTVTGWKASRRVLSGLREQAELARRGVGPNLAGEVGQTASGGHGVSSAPQLRGEETDPVRFEIHPRRFDEEGLVVRMLSQSGKPLMEFAADSPQGAEELISSLQHELAESGDLRSFLDGHGVPTHLVRDACRGS